MTSQLKTDEELDKLRDKHCTSALRKGYKNFSGYAMPESFQRIQKDVDEFEVYDDDVWVTSFPKCGTTWTQEMVWCIANNVDLEAAKVDLDLRFPFIEYCCVFDVTSEKSEYDFVLKSVQFAKEAKRPRFIKTHLPWDFLPKQIRNFEKRPKIFHVVRNPKDVCISYYHHLRLLEYYTGDFNTHWQLFLRDKLAWCPFVDCLLSYWNRRDEPNVHIIKFEDMKANLEPVLRDVAKFLQVNLKEEQVKVLLKHLSFDEMKKNHAVDHTRLINFLKANDLCYDLSGKFMRSGGSGSPNSEMTPEIIASFDGWLEVLASKGLKF